MARGGRELRLVGLANPGKAAAGKLWREDGQADGALCANRCLAILSLGAGAGVGIKNYQVLLTE